MKNTTQAMPKLRFDNAPDAAFRRDLQDEAAKYLQSAGGARHADGWQYAKALGLALGMVAAYAAALLAASPALFALAYVGAVCLAIGSCRVPTA